MSRRSSTSSVRRGSTSNSIGVAIPLSSAMAATDEHNCGPLAARPAGLSAEGYEEVNEMFMRCLERRASCATPSGHTGKNIARSSRLSAFGAPSPPRQHVYGNIASVRTEVMHAKCQAANGSGQCAAQVAGQLQNSEHQRSDASKPEGRSYRACVSLCSWYDQSTVVWHPLSATVLSIT